MNLPDDRHNDNRWNRAMDLLVAIWNRHGPDATLKALTALELTDPAGDSWLDVFAEFGCLPDDADPSPSAGSSQAAATQDCRQPCDADCPFGRVHCWNWHRPEGEPDWHHPARCDAANKNAATREAG